jgi:hypothetical protein
MWKTVERCMTALANCVLRAGSAGVRLGWWLAGGSEVRAAEDELRWSLAEYLFLQRNTTRQTFASLLYPLASTTSALRRIASLSG